MKPLQVLLWGHHKNDDVIKVNDAPSELQITQTSLHQVLKYCQSVCQHKQHTLTLKEPKGAHHEGG